MSAQSIHCYTLCRFYRQVSQHCASVMHQHLQHVFWIQLELGYNSTHRQTLQHNACVRFGSVQAGAACTEFK